VDQVFDRVMADTQRAEQYAKLCHQISCHPNTPKVRNSVTWLHWHLLYSLW
jgi:hypothetical protein